MATIRREFSNRDLLDTPLGQRKVDSEGAPICGVRMDVASAYAGIPALLQKVIDHSDATAWAEILSKIDYIYAHPDHALGNLDRETGFAAELHSRTKSGKKLLYKPNLVGPHVIDAATHGEGLGSPICTEWSFVAALMRWFHDNLDINYHQMCLGEASTSTSLLARMFSDSSGQAITTEAIIEGRSADFYGGWVFYFVRRYLSERHPASHQDDPMRGYEESVAGKYIPPGRAGDRLMVYDLNKVHDDASKGRTVAVPDGANFKEITLHKVIVGGDPRDPEDLRDYPGCVLVNVPKLKIHAQDLLTNAIKNLGIGLYPVHAPADDNGGDTRWKYSFPSTSIPSFKGKLPHMPWVAQVDEGTHLPVKDEEGEYVVTKTAGMPGTQADMLRAVQSQDVFMVHVVDAIDTINISHNPDGNAVRVPEGYVWSCLDCVAVDLFCARYCFKTLPMREAIKLKQAKGWPTEFVHHVPVARIEGTNITTVEGLDSPLFRYNLYRYAEQRGVGQQKYYVVGWDGLTHTRLASVEGHLGRVDDGRFHELMTTTMYYNPSCMLWDMQETTLSYAKAHDILTGSSLLKEFMDSFDENGDGVIDYDENGRNGFWTPCFSMLAHSLHLQLNGRYGVLRGSFHQIANVSLKFADEHWNHAGHDFMREYALVWTAAVAFQMSQAGEVSPDPFVSGMKWGKGMWPSWQLAKYALLTGAIYGSSSYMNVSLPSLYGSAFQYADKALDNGTYTGSTEVVSDPDSIHKYFDAVSRGAHPLDFTLYVPAGYGSLDARGIPNVKETDDPSEIFTAHFSGGLEVW